MNLYLFQRLLGLGTIVLHIFLTLLLIYLGYRMISGNKNKVVEDYLFNNNILLVTIFSGISILVSLIFSEIYFVLPCSLCWIQRIIIFFIFVLGLVLLFNKKKIYKFLLLLAIPGFMVAAYQTMTQFQLKAVPLLECVAIPGADCAKINMLEFGYITIPVMSLTFFAYVIVLGIGRTKNLNNGDKKTNI